MKRFIFVLIVVMSLLIGCAWGNDNDKKTFTSLSDFEGMKIGTLNGTVFAKFIDPVVPGVEHKYFTSLSETVAALSTDEVDAISLDMPVAKYLTAQHTEYIIFPDVVACDSYGFAVRKGSPFTKKSNEVLQKLQKNGTVNEVAKVWFSTDESKKTLPELNYKKDFDARAGTLKCGSENTMVPMSYLGSDGKSIGFDLDIISRIAYEMNMKVEFVPMSFDALLPALASGKVDIVNGSMSITEQRQKLVDFIGPYYDGGIVFVIKKERLGK